MCPRNVSDTTQTSYTSILFLVEFQFYEGHRFFDVLGHDVWEVKKANFDQTQVKRSVSSFWQIRVHLSGRVCSSAVPGFRILWLIS